MSEVIGFRLDRQNPREAQALSVIARWQEQGYSIRYILTEALINLEQAETENIQRVQIEQILEALKKVSGQFEQLQQTDAPGLVPAKASQARLADSFVSSVKNAARSGVRLEE